MFRRGGLLREGGGWNTPKRKVGPGFFQLMDLIIKLHMFNVKFNLVNV